MTIFQGMGCRMTKTNITFSIGSEHLSESVQSLHSREKRGRASWMKRDVFNTLNQLLTCRIDIYSPLCPLSLSWIPIRSVALAAILALHASNGKLCTEYGFEIFSLKIPILVEWKPGNLFWGHIFTHISGSIEPIVSQKNKIHPCVDSHQPCKFHENRFKTATCIVTIIIIIS